TIWSDSVCAMACQNSSDKAFSGFARWYPARTPSGEGSMAASGIHVPLHYNFATDCVDRWAEDPNRIALHWVDAAGQREQRFTFAQLRDASRRVAGALQALGLERGDRVKIVLGREPAWWICVVGMMRAGIVWVPGTTLLAPKDYAYRVGAARIAGLIVDSA